MPTVSIAKGRGYLNHNDRSIDRVSEKSWDPELSRKNVICRNIPIEDAYEQLFGKALNEYNHVFTQEELKGTEYEGKNVEVRDGVMYVEGRSVVAMTCYLWATSSYVLVGWMASGQFQATVDWFDKASLAYDLIKDAWNRFGPSASSTYVKGSASTVYLTNGNICYRQSYNTYACKYSLRPDEGSD
jgi:hypothetical protein